MLKKTRAYRFLNLPVEEEVSIKAKYSAYYLNNVSKPSRTGHSNAVNAWYDTYTPVDFLMTNICLSLNQSKKKKKSAMNKDVCWSEPLRITARTLCI